jgi:hypothetical protein
VCLLAAASLLNAEEGWWMREPIRWVQTNLRENDAALKPATFVREVAHFDANALLMALGGISAFYPSKVQFHYVSPYIPKGHDTFGEVLELAHQHGIHVIGRFDFSKTHKDAWDAHPEWFSKRPTAGLQSTTACTRCASTVDGTGKRRRRSCAKRSSGMT